MHAPLPEHVLRTEYRHEPASTSRQCGGELSCIGEQVSEKLRRTLVQLTEYGLTRLLRYVEQLHRGICDALKPEFTCALLSCHGQA